MEPDPEEEPGNREGDHLSGAETAEEEKEQEREEKRDHDGAESDSGKIDGPKRCRQQKGGEECRGTAPEELPGKEPDTEYGKRSENSGPELERWDSVSEEGDRDCLEIDEESFPSEIVRIEELVISGFVCGDGVGAVHRFVGIESRRDRVYVITAEHESEERDRDDHREEKCAGTEKLRHSFFFLLLCCCGIIIPYKEKNDRNGKA